MQHEIAVEVPGLARMNVVYQDAYQKLLDTANAHPSRPLGDGFRSEGKLTSASLERVLLLAGGLRVDLSASGTLRLLYGF